MTPARPPRRTQAERSEDTCRRILDAAVTLLGERGYAGLRTADVAAAAGVSKGALTHHFRSKDALVVAVVEHVFHRASALARERAERARPAQRTRPGQPAPPGRRVPPGERLQRARSVDEAIRALTADAQEFFFSELFLIALDLAIQGRLQTGSGRAVVQLSAATRLPVEAHWRAALVESGVPPALADDLLWLTLSIVRGLAIRRVWQHDPPRFRRLFRLWRTMVANHLQAVASGREGQR